MKSTITFYKQNRLDMEHSVSIDTIIADFLVSQQYENFAIGMPFEECLLIHMANTYGTFDNIPFDMWKIIRNTFTDMESKHILATMRQYLENKKS